MFIIFLRILHGGANFIFNSSETKHNYKYKLVELRYEFIVWYELPHELPNNLRLRKLGNIRDMSKIHRVIA